MVSFERLAEITKLNLPAALCIVIETNGSTPRKAGSKMLVLHDESPYGRVEGSIGGGAIEHQIRLEAIESIRSGQSKIIRHSLTHDLGMCCGGQMTVFVEPLSPKPTCIIFGAGHIGEALSRLAAQAGFFIIVADTRNELLRAERLPYAQQMIHLASRDLSMIPFGENAFVTIATHDHQKDQELVEAILPKPFYYAALVGSKRKAKMTIARCLNKGFDIEQIKKIHCPAGLEIEAETPEEIAVSIVAQMIQHRRKNK